MNWIRLHLPAKKAFEVLNWKAQRSLKQMIEDEWRFYQNTLKR
jgi:UDP-glucose 4-epimerase